MTLSKNNTMLKIMFAITLSIVITPVFAHSAAESAGLFYAVLHPLFSLDHVSARLLLGSVIVFLAYKIMNTSQYKQEKYFGIGFAASGIMMMLNF